MRKQYVLLIDVRKGETLDIGGRLALRVEEKSGSRARLRLVFKEPTAVSKVKELATLQEQSTTIVEGMAGA